jgi:hypothetical protein
MMSQFIRGAADFTLYILVWVVSGERRKLLAEKTRSGKNIQLKKEDDHVKGSTRKYAAHFFKLALIGTNFGSIFGNLTPAIFEQYGQIKNVLYLNSTAGVTFLMLQFIKLVYTRFFTIEDKEKIQRRPMFLKLQSGKFEGISFDFNEEDERQECFVEADAGNDVGQNDSDPSESSDAKRSEAERS